MEPARAVVQKVEGWLRRQGVAAGGVVVAVSGGPDSVALLRLLLEVRPREMNPLVVAHLNHRLRGAESDADEAFVRDLATMAAARLCCDRIDVAAVAREQGTNLESTARRLRYDWLVRVAREQGAAWIATGHTTDDQAETVLHRLLRGAGLKGLRGIAPRRPLAPGIELIRPLLDLRRAELLAYLHAEGQPYRLDSSNADPRFTRNRIRHELLPLLTTGYNAGLVPVLCRLAEQADEAYRLAEEQARRLLVESERPPARGLLVFDRAALTAAPRAQVREMFRLVWEREGWPVDAMGFDGWERLAAVALGEVPAADFPGGVQARCRARVVRVGRAC